MSDLVTIDIRDGVADVRLNRPHKYNALSRDMFAEFSPLKRVSPSSMQANGLQRQKMYAPWCCRGTVAVFVQGSTWKVLPG